ncbi:MAG: DUF4368 domain-containing protein, partial [Oscillospiraceae bacterium]|nr:DUF4368 domain-containing protein [Oscillospiraceae bacterium]
LHKAIRRQRQRWRRDRHYNINHPNSSIEYFNCSNYRGNRGTCNETHYIRADSLEQEVLLELNRMVSYLKHHAEEFAELLAQKTTKDYERESRNRRQRLQELTARNKEVDRLFERIYEDRVLGHLSVEQFQTLSGGYTEEQTKLSQDIPAKEIAIQKLRDTVSSTDGFIAKAKRYTDITELTPEPLRLFIQKIVVYEESTKWSKHALQTIEIHYNDIGCVRGNKQRIRKTPDRKSLRDSCRGYSPDSRYPYAGAPKPAGSFSLYSTAACSGSAAGI